MRFDADYRRGAARRKPGKVKAGATADVQHRLATPVVDLPHGRLEHAVWIDAHVLLLVDVRMPPDVGAGMTWLVITWSLTAKACRRFWPVGTT
jgi:hypothetical protein